MMKAVVEESTDEEVETAKTGRVEEEEVAETDSIAQGVEVPIPTAPVKVEALDEVDTMYPAVRG